MVVGQEIELSWAEPSMLVTTHDAAPPVGSVEVTTFPEPSTAAQNVRLAHCSPVMAFEPSTVAGVHAEVPAVGSAETSTESAPAAAQNDAVGHSIDVETMDGTDATAHADAPPVGSVEVTTFPSPAEGTTHSDDVGHEIAVNGVEPSMLVTVHEAAPPVGSVEVTTLPELSAAAQKVAVGHETALRLLAMSEVAARAHADAPPVGSVEVTTPPSAPTATHNVEVGHAMFVRAPSGTVVGIHCDGLPVGSVDVSTAPPCARAVQNEEVGQETDSRLASTPPGLVVSVHAPTPPVGLVDIATKLLTKLPLLSVWFPTATQSEVAGHEIAVRPSAPATFAELQLAAPPVGSVEVTTSPALSIAAQNEAVGQEMAVSEIFPLEAKGELWSTSSGGDHVGAVVAAAAGRTEESVGRAATASIATAIGTRPEGRRTAMQNRATIPDNPPIELPFVQPACTRQGSRSDE